jgi:hypothetical protein
MRKIPAISILLLVGIVLAACAAGTTIEERATQDSFIKDALVGTPKQARDLKRQTDLISMMNGIEQYLFDNFHQLPDSIPRGRLLDICAAHAITCEGKADLRFLVSEYLSELPQDPVAATEEKTGYTIMIDPDGTVTIEAPRAEGDETRLSITQ